MVTIFTNVYYIYDQTDIRVVHRRPQKGVLEEAGGGEQHNITAVAPNELKLDVGG